MDEQLEGAARARPPAEADAAPVAAGGSGTGQPLDMDASVARILRERARRLAATAERPATGAQVEAMLCRLGQERYAIDLGVLRAVQPATGLTPVPCTPAFIAGVLNVRGEILGVLDLAVALGLTGSPTPPDGAAVLIVEVPPVRVGLLVDEVLGLERLSLDDLAPPSSGSQFVRGVADARTVLLGAEQLLASGRFDVLEDVS